MTNIKWNIDQEGRGYQKWKNTAKRLKGRILDNSDLDNLPIDVLEAKKITAEAYIERNQGKENIKDVVARYDYLVALITKKHAEEAFL